MGFLFLVLYPLLVLVLPPPRLPHSLTHSPHLTSPHLNLLLIDFSLLSIEINLLLIDFNLLSIEINLLLIDFNLLSIEITLLSIDFNLLSIEINLLAIYFQLISIYFWLTSIYFQFTFKGFVFFSAPKGVGHNRVPSNYSYYWVIEPLMGYHLEKLFGCCFLIRI